MLLFVLLICGIHAIGGPGWESSNSNNERKRNFHIRLRKDDDSSSSSSFSSSDCPPQVASVTSNDLLNAAAAAAEAAVVALAKGGGGGSSGGSTSPVVAESCLEHHHACYDNGRTIPESDVWWGNCSARRLPNMYHVFDVYADQYLNAPTLPEFDNTSGVTSQDVTALQQFINSGGYFPLYDVDASCVVDNADKVLIARQNHELSTQLDQQVASFLHHYRCVGELRGQSSFFYDPTGCIASLGSPFVPNQPQAFPIPVPLKGHGNHWFTPKGLATMQGFAQLDPWKLEGINIPTDDPGYDREDPFADTAARAHGLMWPGLAIPMFSDAFNLTLGHGYGVFDFFLNPGITGLSISANRTYLTSQYMAFGDRVFHFCKDLDNPDSIGVFVATDATCATQDVCYIHTFDETPEKTCYWMFQRVQQFANPHPEVTSDNVCEAWHTHGGLCMFELRDVDHHGNILYGNVTGSAQQPPAEAHQYLTFFECLALAADTGFRGQLGPTDVQQPSWGPVSIDLGGPQPLQFPPVLWANFWMVHFWMFDLNPLGTFAGWHPCIEHDAPPEAIITSVSAEGYMMMRFPQFPDILPQPVPDWFHDKHGIAGLCCKGVPTFVGLSENDEPMCRTGFHACCNDPLWACKEACVGKGLTNPRCGDPTATNIALRDAVVEYCDSLNPSLPDCPKPSTTEDCQWAVTGGDAGAHN